MRGWKGGVCLGGGRFVHDEGMDGWYMMRGWYGGVQYNEVMKG